MQTLTRRRTTLALVAATALLTACGSVDTVIRDPASGSATLAPTDGSPPATTADTSLGRVPPLHPSVDDWDQATIDLISSDGRVETLAVLVAQTPAQRSHGLMEVTDLPVGTGMVFLFDEDGTTGFWMKNTLIPLDIAYVAADGWVVSTTTMVPCPPDESCPSYPPDGPYRLAIEVPAGHWDEIGLDTTWRVEVKR